MPEFFRQKVRQVSLPESKCDVRLSVLLEVNRWQESIDKCGIDPAVLVSTLEYIHQELKLTNKIISTFMG